MVWPTFFELTDALQLYAQLECIFLITQIITFCFTVNEDFECGKDIASNIAKKVGISNAHNFKNRPPYLTPNRVIFGLRPRS